MGFNEFPKIGPNALNNVYGVVDPYVAGSGGSDGNGALNPLGSIWTIPSPSQGGIALASSIGYGSYLTVKYVRYNSTSNPAMVAGPGVVYYTDETLTTVSGAFAESYSASNPTYAAGFLLPNTGSVAGVGLGSGVSAALLNGNYVFIALAGFVPKAYVASLAQGNPFMGGTGAFTSVVTTTILRTIGWVWGTVTSNIADVVMGIPLF